MGKKVSDDAYNTWVDAFKAAYATEEFSKIQKEKGLLPLNLAGADLDGEVTKQMEVLRAIARESGLIQ
jgi:putative tricarboxylic transport membrane protein